MVKAFKNGPHHSRFFKGCLLQILFGLFLNTLTHILSQFVWLLQAPFKHESLLVNESKHKLSGNEKRAAKEGRQYWFISTIQLPKQS